MTPCEKLGYKVGDEFEIVANNSGHKFNIGDIASLLIDDASIMPRMKVGLKSQWVYLIDLKKISNSEGWIEWKGGECPVEKGTLVDVKYEDEYIELSVPALIRNPCGKKRNAITWGVSRYETGIIAYRLSETKKTNGDDLVPFNESDDSEYKNEVSDPGFIIVNLISSVAPKVSVSDALEIAATLLEYGFKK